jgi:hypothetical protein
MRSPQDFCASDPPVRDHPLGLRGGLAQLLALRLRRGARRGDLVLEVGPGLGPRLRRAGLRLLRTRRELRQLVRERHCSSFFQPFPERRASRPESTLHRLPQCLAAGWVTGRHAFLVIDRTTGIAVGSARVEPVTPASLRFTGSPARGPHPVRHGRDYTTAGPRPVAAPLPAPDVAQTEVNLRQPAGGPCDVLRRSVNGRVAADEDIRRCLGHHDLLSVLRTAGPRMRRPGAGVRGRHGSGIRDTGRPGTATAPMRPNGRAGMIAGRRRARRVDDRCSGLAAGRSVLGRAADQRRPR